MKIYRGLPIAASRFLPGGGLGWGALFRCRSSTDCLAAVRQCLLVVVYLNNTDVGTTTKYSLARRSTPSVDLPVSTSSDGAQPAAMLTTPRGTTTSTQKQQTLQDVRLDCGA
jgi:hypothetical protein